jgi:phosphinothricin acetyltransferase
MTGEADTRRARILRECTEGDGEALCAIYNHYVVQTTATFEETAVSADEMARRIAEVTRRLPWIVCEEGGVLVGYAYAMPWKSRAAYRHSVETTIYLHSDATGRGIGTELYQSLLDRLRRLGTHCVVGGIALPNPASVALHERLGFVRAGHFHEIGMKFGRWVDVGYWERRFPEVRATRG